MMCEKCWADYGRHLLERSHMTDSAERARQEYETARYHVRYDEGLGEKEAAYAALDAAVLALMVEAFNEGSAAEADDMIHMEEWERVRKERTTALLKVRS